MSNCKLHYIVYDRMSQCTEADVARLLPLVSEQRRAYALAYKHLFGQWAALKTYELLFGLIYPERSMEERKLFFAHNEYGKPFLPDGPFFSISHCKTGLLVAVDTEPIGVDIECVTRRVSEDLVEKVMNATEKAQIQSSPDPQRAFIRLWTQKEAVLKCLGTGINEDLKETLVRHRMAVQTYETELYSYSIVKGEK